MLSGAARSEIETALNTRSLHDALPIYGFTEIELHPVLCHVLLSHGRKGRADQSGHDLIGDFDNRSFNAPQVSERLGHFKTNEACADDYGIADFAFGNFLTDSDGVVRVADLIDASQIFARRSEERRGGKECSDPGRSRWAPDR